MYDYVSSLPLASRLRSCKARAVEEAWLAWLTAVSVATRFSSSQLGKEVVGYSGHEVAFIDGPEVGWEKRCSD